MWIYAWDRVYIYAMVHFHQYTGKNKYYKDRMNVKYELGNEMMNCEQLLRTNSGF